MKKVIMLIFSILLLCSSAVALELNPELELIALNANNNIVVTKQGNTTNYQSKQDPFYLAQEYKQMPKDKKEQIVKNVKNYDSYMLPIYYIVVAEDIYATDKSLAAFLYAIGRYRSIQDVAMCTDKSAYQAISGLPLVAPLTSQYISKMKEKDLANLLQNVIMWDVQNSKRPSPKWICYHGLGAFLNNGNVTVLPISEYENKKKEVRKSTAEYIEELQK